MIHALLSHFAAGCNAPSFFGLKPWYAYLNTDSSCNITSFEVLKNNGTSDVALVILAIVDDLLRIGGVAAIIYVIYGGYTYIRSQGSPELTQKAQHTIQNALVGLIVAIVSIALVSFIGGKVGTT